MSEYFPSSEEFERLSKEATVVPVYRELIAARVVEVKPAAAGKLERLRGDPATCVPHPLEGGVEVLGVEDDQRAPRRHLGRQRQSSRLAALLPDAGVLLRCANREPTVRMSADALEDGPRGNTRAANPHRNRALDWRGVDAVLPHSIELSFEGQFGLGPEATQELHLLTAPPPACREILAKRTVFAPVAADPNDPSTYTYSIRSEAYDTIGGAVRARSVLDATLFYDPNSTQAYYISVTRQ